MPLDGICIVGRIGGSSTFDATCFLKGLSVFSHYLLYEYVLCAYGLVIL